MRGEGLLSGSGSVGSIKAWASRLWRAEMVPGGALQLALPVAQPMASRRVGVGNGKE